MYRHLLVLVVAAGLAVPGIMSVSTSITDAPAAPPASTPLAVPTVVPTIVPTVTPSPGDLTPPVTTASGMGTRWRNDAATVKLAATDDQSGVAATVYSVDDGPWKLGDQLTVKAPRDHSNDGEHVITFYSVDNALNQEAFKTATVRIDTRPPRFAWSGITPGIIRHVEPVTLRFTIDERSGPVTVSYKVTDQYGYFAARKSRSGARGGRADHRADDALRERQGLRPRRVPREITVRDEAGNVTVTNRRSFRDYRAATGGVWHSSPRAAAGWRSPSTTATTPRGRAS